jgi:hypothetical protein
MENLGCALLKSDARSCALEGMQKMGSTVRENYAEIWLWQGKMLH